MSQTRLRTLFTDAPHRILATGYVSDPPAPYLTPADVLIDRQSFRPPAPLNCTVEIRCFDADIWLRVRWNDMKGWFDVEGDESWLLPEEIDEWREPAHPSIGIGSPRE